MLKLIEMPGVSESGDILVQAFVPEHGLAKTAATDRLHPDIRKFVEALKPDPDKLYVLVNALGAGEFYGSNINGDYFEEAELSRDSELAGYKTFLRSGVYRHHQNKDIKRSMGKVVLAVYNWTMHRVELVIEIDRKKARQEGHGDLVEKLDAGKNPAVSMGCRVKYDVCSICGNKSKTRADYCIHAKTMMNQILPNGQKVYVTNPNCRFFDLSFVIIGADRTSYAMAKVARVMTPGAVVLSADLAEQCGLRDRSYIKSWTEKLAERQKLSKLMKRIPAMSARVIPPITDKEPGLPDHVLDRLSRYPLKKALTTCSAAGIVLKPAEYQRLVLARMGKKGRADQLAKQGMVFRPAQQADTSVGFGDLPDYDPDVLDLLRPYLADRSMFDPLLSRRVGREKTANAQVRLRFVDDPLLGKIAAGYLGYRQQLLLKIADVVDTVTVRDPSLLSALSGQKLEDLFVDTALAKSASILPLALLGAVPLAYLYGAHKAGTGETESTFGSWVADHPILATSVLVGLTRLGVGLQQSGHMSQLLAKVVKG
jgi:hypothetical protein